jgi:hypothetical protein
MLDSHDTALDRPGKGAYGADLSVQDPLARKVGLLERDTESAKSEKDSCNDKRLDQQRAPLNHSNWTDFNKLLSKLVYIIFFTQIPDKNVPPEQAGFQLMRSQSSGGRNVYGFAR